MSTGYEVYCPYSNFKSSRLAWSGMISCVAYEHKDYVHVIAQFTQGQTIQNSDIYGTDKFYASFVINGKQHNFSFNRLCRPGTAYQTYSSYKAEETIYFDSNGNAPLSIAVSVQGATGSIVAGHSLNGTLNYTFSNRASQTVVSMNPSAKTMGDQATITATGGKGTIRIHIYYTFGNLRGDILQKQLTQFDYGSYKVDWTIPDLLDGCPNAAGGSLKIVCDTYRFDSLVGTSSLVREISAFPATEFALPPGDSFYIGHEKDIPLKRYSSKYTMNIRYALVEEHEMVRDIQSDSYHWKVPVSLGREMASASYSSVYMYCDTYHGTAKVGTVSERYAMRVNTDDEICKPIIDSATVEASVLGAPEEFQGLMLQNISKVKLTIKAHTDSSEIKEYKLDAFGLNESSKDGLFVVTPNVHSGKHKLIVKVFDRRGGKREKEIDVTVLPYSKPRVIPYTSDGTAYNAPICYRSDKEGMAVSSGPFMRILVGKSHTDIIKDGMNINSSSLVYRIRRGTEQWPDKYLQLLPMQDKDNFISSILADSFPDPRSSYQVELVAKDKIGNTHEIIIKISSEKVSFSLRCAKDGAAFGKTSEYPGVVEIAQDMTLLVQGDLVVSGTGWTELKSVVNENTWESGFTCGFQKTSGCHYRVENGNRINVIFNRAIKWNGTPITLNSDPIPVSHRPERPISMLCAAENGIVMATVDTEGLIKIDYVWGNSSQFRWINGLVYYWKEDRTVYEKV